MANLNEERAKYPIGSYVMITEKGIPRVPGRYAKLQKLRIPGKVVYVSKMAFKIQVSWSEILPFDTSFGTWEFYHMDAIRPATEEEIQAFPAIAEECRKQMYAEKRAFIDDMLERPIIPAWEERDLSTSSRAKLHSNHNTLSLGDWNKEAGTFIPRQDIYKGTCCSVTKTKNDLEVFIPKIWLAYYGYSKTDLKKWLTFLGKCGMDFEGELVGEAGLPDRFKAKIPQRNLPENYLEEVGPYMIGEANVSTGKTPLYPIDTDGFYTVRIKRGKCTYHTYMMFICMRYMYNHYYWNIPLTAMLIKRQLGSRISHMQALLMAHLREPYYSYYCLVSNEKQVRVFQSVQEVIKKLENRFLDGLNGMWRYAEYGNVADYFKNKDFKGLFKVVKAKDNVKVK